MTLIYCILLLVTGLVAGFAGGLLGVGGGFIMTPVQYFIFADMGLSTDVAIKLAFGTNLLVILPMAVSAAWRHSRKGIVQWRTAIVMGVSASASAFLGAGIASRLPGDWLKIAFGVISILSGIRMLMVKKEETTSPPRESCWLWAAWAVPIGLLTGILGIGGGVLAVPVLSLVLKFEIHRAMATSLAIMMFTSFSAVIGYTINGIDAVGLPEYSLGYVYLPSWVLLMVSSIVMAQVGAIAAHHLPSRKLGYIFIVLLFYMGMRMLGIFEWLGLPL
ncbi:MAG: sulfite exporter TauE/SafE family protein [Dehalococcoidales bacterium]|nr:sulfite exporter TauE/SafE family protein [Dehalococcoidales bacterium]